MKMKLSLDAMVCSLTVMNLRFLKKLCLFECVLSLTYKVAEIYL